MSAATLFYTLFAYAAMAIFLVGFLLRTRSYAKTPSPFKTPLAPAFTTCTDLAYRMIQRVEGFKSLFYSNRVIWLDGHIMHLAFALTLAKHFRFFLKNTAHPSGRIPANADVIVI